MTDDVVGWLIILISNIIVFAECQIRGVAHQTQPKVIGMECLDLSSDFRLSDSLYRSRDIKMSLECLDHISLAFIDARNILREGESGGNFRILTKKYDLICKCQEQVITLCLLITNTPNSCTKILIK